MALSSSAPTGVLLASAARTADAYSDAQFNDMGYPGLLITMTTSAEAGTCSITPTIQFLDAASNTWITALAGTAITTDTTTTWTLYPAASITDGSYTVESAMPIPLVWRFFWDQTTADTTTGFTVSVGYQYLP